MRRVPADEEDAGRIFARAPAGTAFAADPIKIGGAFNLTGGQASLDGPAKNGAQMAIDAINAAGGVNGRPLELVVYDGKTDPAVITSLASQHSYRAGHSSIFLVPLLQQCGGGVLFATHSRT